MSGMKRYSLYIITVVIGLFVLNACQNDDVVDRTEVVEGIPVTLSIPFSLIDSKEVTTKSDLTTEQENQIKDLYLFIFNKQGNLEYGAPFTGLYQSGGSKNSGSLNLPENAVTSGRKTIIALANVNSAAVKCLNESGNEVELSRIETFADLDKLVIKFNEDRSQREDANLVMSGYCGSDFANSKINKGLVTIPVPTSSDSETTLSEKIYLSHLDSRITFKVIVDDVATKEFVPAKWKVVNVPRSSYLLERPINNDSGNYDASMVEADFFATREENFEAFIQKENVFEGGSFSFYMNENRKAPKKQITDKEATERGKSLYALREYKTEQGGRPEDPFAYANAYATYVVLTGTFYQYDSKHELIRSAEVRYTIHLGYLQNVANDFNSERNYSYIYNVKIKDVDNIVLEVTSSQEGKFQENQPGAEGSVIQSDQSFLLDAHYGVRSVTFNKDNLENLSVMVKTPYESPKSASEARFVVDKKTGNATDNLFDFEWVEFARNNQSGNVYNSNYLSYKEVKDGNKKQFIKEVLKDLWDYKYGTKKSEKGFWDKNGNVTYTVFINEFYYEENPVNKGITTWKEFVNKPSRQMHILCDTEYSLDGQSSLTKSNIMINQRSIRTVYNTSSSSLSTAWGIETVCEEAVNDEFGNKIGQLKLTGLKEGELFSETKTNGRYNTFQWLNNQNKTWSNYVEAAHNRYIKGTAEYICLHRNKDLDGDDVIDDDEIRWYLPATNQYVGLWIGQDVLPSEARLLQATVSTINTTTRFDHHLISSNGVRFWTEEGVSTGSNTQKGQNQFYVRCARNLGMSNAKPSSKTDEPEDFVKVTLDAKGHVSFVDLSNMDPAAWRSSTLPVIDFHNEHTSGTANRPYSSFTVYGSTTLADIYYTKDKSQQSNNKLPNDLCPEGYRIPNQRELALIAGYSTKSFAETITTGDRIETKRNWNDNYYPVPGSDWNWIREYKRAGLWYGRWERTVNITAEVNRLGSCTYTELGYKVGKDGGDQLYTMIYKNGINFLTLSADGTNAVRCIKDGR